MTNVNCNPSSVKITDCSYGFSDSCSRLAGVACMDKSTFGLTDSLILYSTKADKEYVIATKSNLWTSKESSVLCKQLAGYTSPTRHELRKAYRNNGYKCVMSDVKCRGNEKGLEECLYNILNNCPSSFYHVYVTCPKCGESDFTKIVRSALLVDDQKQQYQAMLNAISNLKSSCREWDCSRNEYPQYCETLMYLNWIKGLSKPGDKRVVFLNTQQNYREELKLTFLKRKFTDLQADIQNIDHKIDGFQKKLGDHFKQTANFDVRKTQTEVNKLLGDWNDYKRLLSNNKNELKIKLGELKTIAAAVLSADIIETATDVVLLSIQSFYDGIDDILGNAVELRRTAADLAKKKADALRIYYIAEKIDKLQIISHG